MRLYDNPLIAICTLLGITVKKGYNKLDNIFEDMDKRKTYESLKDYSSDSKENQMQRKKRAEQREKLDFRCAVIGLSSIFIAIFLPPIPAIVVCGIGLIAMVYCLWYLFFGKYL